MATCMALKAACLACLVLCMAKPHAGQGEVFDVTEYGAAADGKTENSKAFLAAWKEACEYKGSARFVIPKGDFLLGPVVFSGPCYNNLSPAVEIKGTVKAIRDFKTVGWMEFRELHELTVSGGGTLDGQGDQIWGSKGKRRNLPTSLRFAVLSNATVSDISLVNSKGFQMNIHRSAIVTARNLKITAPEDSPNTDGIHISGSDRVNITSSKIGTGDDCISIGPGATHVFISDIVCGPGHGISVGSLGKYPNEKDVVGLTVKNCTVSGTTNGLRIKTWPGSQPSKATDITFEDVIVDNVANPIIIDQEYCPGDDCSTKPSLVQISGVTFRNVRGTSNTEVAVSLGCSEKVPCQNVQLHDINLEHVDGDTTSSCSNVKGAVSGTQKPDPCLR